MSEWYAAVKGQRFGPISEDALKEWIASGRVGPDDHVWREGMAEWTRSADVPELAGAAPSAGAAMPGAMAPMPGVASQWAPPVRHSAPHRGGAILALGIVSIAMTGCLIDIICGFIALNMAKKDLPLMAAGQMDPAGKGLADAGRICGIIGIVKGFLWLGVALIYLIFIFGIIASNGF